MIHPIRRRRERDQQRVATVLRLDPQREWHVTDLSGLLGISAVRTWMALWGQEQEGRVTSRWEELRSDEDRPRRRLYRAADGGVHG